MFGFPADFFGMNGGNNRRSNNNSLIRHNAPFFGNQLMVPSPFGEIDRIFGGFGMPSSPFAMMDRMMRATNDSLLLGGHRDSNGPVQSFSSTTVMSFNGTDGRPKVYQESTAHRRGPGGIEETRQAIRDSERGINKVQIGHRIGDRQHVVEREMNVQTGQISENVELENLDEEEAESFKREWRERSAMSGLSRNPHPSYHHRHLTSNRPHHPSSSETYQPPLAIEHSSSQGLSSNRYQQKFARNPNSSSQRPQHHRTETIDLTGDTPRIEEVEEIEQLPSSQGSSSKRKASSTNDADVHRKHRQNRF